MYVCHQSKYSNSGQKKLFSIYLLLSRYSVYKYPENRRTALTVTITKQYDKYLVMYIVYFVYGYTSYVQVRKVHFKTSSYVAD